MMRLYIKSMSQVFLVLTVVFVSLFSLACSYNMGLFSKQQLFHDSVLARNIVISTEWQEIDVTDKVVIERDTQLIALVLEPPYETPYGSSGVKVPSGEIINPEILLLDDLGNEYLFSIYGAGGTDTIRYSHRGRLPTDGHYTKVMLRSELPINTRQVLWSTYSAHDLK